jgi:hypothetical protein
MTNVERAAAFVREYERANEHMRPSLRRAMILSEAAKYDEADLLQGGEQYSEEHARISVVHTRHDVVLMCSYLSDIAQSVRVITRWANFLGWVAGATFVLLALFLLKSLHWWPS